MKLTCIKPTKTLSKGASYKCTPVSEKGPKIFVPCGYNHSSHYKTKNNFGRVIYVSKNRFKVSRWKKYYYEHFK